MLSNRVAAGTLAIACVAAAAGGGYLATRQVNVSTEAAAPAVSAVAATPPTAPVAVVAGPVTSDPVAVVANRGAAPESGPAPVAPSRRDSLTLRPEATGRPAAPAASPATAADGKRRPAAPVPPQTPEVVPASTESTPTANNLEHRDHRASSEPAPDTLPANPVTPASGLTPPAATRPLDPVDFAELVVSADSVIGLQLDHGLSSERARVEQAVDARVVRDVRVGRQVAIPAGSRAIGSVMLVERGGRFKERARLGIRFHTLVLADGTRLSISTDTIYRYGDAPGDGSAKRIGGGAVAGAILGAIVGGAKGAAVGATAGAGGGTAMVMAGERSAAEFPPGTEVTARILSPVAVTIER